MNTLDLKNRVAVVTGGAQGIGLAITKRMLASGATVRIWDRDPKHRVLARIGGLLVLDRRRFRHLGRTGHILRAGLRHPRKAQPRKARICEPMHRTGSGFGTGTQARDEHSMPAVPRIAT